MSEPIRTKPKSSMKIDNAPTPHNTPASVMNNSFLKNGNPVQNERGRNNGASNKDNSEEAAARLAAASAASSTNADGQNIKEEDVQRALANQPLLLQSIQDKLGSLVGQDSGYVDQLPLQIKNRIYGLKKLQSDLFMLEKDFQVEMFELEQKYLQKYAPLHDRRRRIVVGTEEPSDQDINKGREIEKMERADEDEDEDEDINEEAGADEGTDVKGIPSFWLTALENLPVVSDTITDRDAEVLDYLQDVQLEYLTEGKPGFKLIFTFDKETPFFDNQVLTKTYSYQTELGYSGDFIYDHAEGDKINWVDNESNVTITVEKRKQRNKVTKQVRTIEKITPVESFFNFFDPPRAPNSAQDETKQEQQQDSASESAEDGLEDEDELEELEQRLALDYSIGEQLKDKLIPRAIDWFTGAALEFEFDNDQNDEFEEGDEDEDDDEDDDDEDDDDDDDDDEEEEDDFAGKKENPPECKQS